MKTIFLTLVAILITTTSYAQSDNLINGKLMPAFHVDGMLIEYENVEPEEKQPDYVRVIQIRSSVFIRDFISNTNIEGKKFEVLVVQNPNAEKDWSKALTLPALKYGALKINVPLSIDTTQIPANQDLEIKTYLVIRGAEAPYKDIVITQAVAFDISYEALK